MEKIISVEVTSQADNISVSEAEMDKRATCAVKAAIARAKVCKKPIAKYDPKLKKAYLEYADGSIEYAK